jgi:hypothetical protein
VLSAVLIAAAAASQVPQTRAVAAATPTPAAGNPGTQAVVPDRPIPAGCQASGDFVPVVGQGPLCQAGNHWVVKLNNGRPLTVAPPDSKHAATIVASSVASSNAAPAAPSALACVNPSTHTHVELWYAHFSGQGDNYGGHAGDIQQMFRDVDTNIIAYDAVFYGGSPTHLYVECDSQGNPVVHDIQLSTGIGGSNFSTIVSDMQNQGMSNPLAHYWIWTDGNPTSGYAGQSTVTGDDSPGPNNQINSSDQYSVNYGYTDANGGAGIFAHENGHAMGAVQLSAPDTTGAWHCIDGIDVMCYNDNGPNGARYTTSDCGPAPNGTNLFDCSRNDYFNPVPAPGSYLATHWNIASVNNAWVLAFVSPTTTSLSASTTSAVYSQPVTLTATVSSGGNGTPGGSVTFSHNGTALGTAALDASGKASLQLTTPGVGSHSLSATYGGSTIYNGSSSNQVTVTISMATLHATLSSNLNPAAANGSIQLSATLSPSAPATSVPSGESVAFYNSSTSLGTATINSSGVATLTWTAPAQLGSYSLTASYSSDGKFASATTPAYTLTVEAPSTTAISSSLAGKNNTAEVGTSVTFSASVSGNAGGSGPSGTVTFLDGTTSLGTVSLNSSHAASLATAQLTPGLHSITARYNGDSTYAMSTGALTEVVLSFNSLVVMDSYGGVSSVQPTPSVTGLVGSVPQMWPGWGIANSVSLDGARGFYVLDGFGAIHSFGSTQGLSSGAYWPNWDIALQAIDCPDGKGGYLLDGFGDVHSFGNAVPVKWSGYWPGWDIAQAFALTPGTSSCSSGASGYVMDGFGGLHPFAGGNAAFPAAYQTAYWPNWDIARALVIAPGGTGGYTLDGFGGVHPFGSAAPVGPTAYWPNWDIARSIALIVGPSGTPSGYTLDGFGGLHPFGAATYVTNPSYTPGSDIARSISLS